MDWQVRLTAVILLALLGVTSCLDASANSGLFSIFKAFTGIKDHAVTESLPSLNTVHPNREKVAVDPAKGDTTTGVGPNHVKPASPPRPVLKPPARSPPKPYIKPSPKPAPKPSPPRIIPKSPVKPSPKPLVKSPPKPAPKPIVKSPVKPLVKSPVKLPPAKLPPAKLPPKSPPVKPIVKPDDDKNKIWPPAYNLDYTITVGFSAKAKLQVKKGEDALPVFKQAIKKLQKNKGGRLLLEAGTYELSSQFVVKSSRTFIQGAGMDKTIIKLADNAWGPWKDAGFFRAVSVSNVTVMDLTLDGNKDKQDPNEKKHYGRYGVYMDDYHNAHFERVAVNNFQRYGYDPHGIKRQGKFIWSHSFTVIDSFAINNNWDGFTFDQTFNVLVRNCTAIGNGRHGFNLCTGSRYAVFEHNKAIHNGFGEPDISHGGTGCGFMVDHLLDESCKCPGFPYDTRDIVYRNNQVIGASDGGFCIQRSHNVTIEKNTVKDAKYCAYFFNEATKSTFRKNSCIRTKNGVGFKNMTKKARKSIRILW